MGGNTGNIRTLRNQSGSNGSRTIGSIISSDGGAGAGSFRRVYGWYERNNNITNFYSNVLNLRKGQLANRAQWLLKR